MLCVSGSEGDRGRMRREETRERPGLLFSKLEDRLDRFTI